MLALPTVTDRVSSPFGWRTIDGQPDYHSGIDYPAPEGSPVVAVLPASVLAIYQSGVMHRYGNTVVLAHAPFLYSLYAHLQTIIVRPGQGVTERQQIGTVGATAGTKADPAALTRAPHLHFEFLRRWPPQGRDRDRMDPVKVFQTLADGKPILTADALPPTERPTAYANDATPPPTKRRNATIPIIAIFAAIALSQRNNKKKVARTRQP